MVGYVAFGAIGGAVGATSGPAKATNYCMDCGTAWQAADVFKVLQAIKEQFGCQLDLAKEHDRILMNYFLNEFIPKITELDRTRTRLANSAVALRLAKPQPQPRSSTGIAIAALFSSLLFFVILNIMVSPYVIVAALCLIMVSLAIGYSYDNHASIKNRDKNWAQKQLAKQYELQARWSQLEADVVKIDSQKQELINDFIASYQANR